MLPSHAPETHAGGASDCNQAARSRRPSRFTPPGQCCSVCSGRGGSRTAPTHNHQDSPTMLFRSFSPAASAFLPTAGFPSQPQCCSVCSGRGGSRTAPTHNHQDSPTMLFRLFSPAASAAGLTAAATISWNHTRSNSPTLATILFHAFCARRCRRDSLILRISGAQA